MGKPLQPGEKSKNGLYGMISKKTNIVLRISLFQEIAAMLMDESRCLVEIWLTGEGDGHAH